MDDTFRGFALSELRPAFASKGDPATVWDNALRLPIGEVTGHVFRDSKGYVVRNFSLRDSTPGQRKNIMLGIIGADGTMTPLLKRVKAHVRSGYSLYSDGRDSYTYWTVPKLVNGDLLFVSGHANTAQVVRMLCLVVGDESLRAEDLKTSDHIVVVPVAKGDKDATASSLLNAFLEGSVSHVVSEKVNRLLNFYHAARDLPKLSASDTMGQRYELTVESLTERIPSEVERALAGAAGHMMGYRELLCRTNVEVAASMRRVAQALLAKADEVAAKPDPMPEVKR